MLLGELLPLKIPRRGEHEELTVSTTFAFALLLVAGLGPAVAAQSVASVVQDVVSRKPLWRVGVQHRPVRDLARRGEPGPDASPASARAGRGAVRGRPTCRRSRSRPPRSSSSTPASSGSPWRSTSASRSRATSATTSASAPSTAAVLLACRRSWSSRCARCPSCIPLFIVLLLAVYVGRAPGGAPPPRGDARPADRAGQPAALQRARRRARSPRASRALRDPAARPRPLQGRQRRARPRTTATGCCRQVAAAAGRRACPRPRESPALGGDEFAVLLAPADGRRGRAGRREPRRAPRCARRSRSRASRSTARRSIGVVHRTRRTATDSDTLLQRGDVAMYRAKDRGRRTRALQRATDDHHSPARLGLIGELRGAIEARPARPALPAEGRPAHRPRRGLRGARALGAPELGLLLPGRVPADGREHGPDPAAHAARARRRRCAECGAWQRRRASS